MIKLLARFALPAVLGSPWLWVAALLALGSLTGAAAWVYHSGRVDGAAITEARWRKIQADWVAEDAQRVAVEDAAIADRDHRIAQAEADADQRTVERLALIDTLQLQVDKYEASEASRADDDCSITDGDAGSLSNIH